MDSSPSSSTPMTKIWCMKIKDPPTANAVQSPFNDLLREILEFCYDRSGPEHARHEFWELDVEQPDQIVMITGYPSVESNVAADREYIASDRLPRMAGWVDSGRLVKCLTSVHGAPLDAERMDFCITAAAAAAAAADDDDDGEELDGHVEDIVEWVGTELAGGKPVGDVKVLMAGRGMTDAVQTGVPFVRLRRRSL